MWKDKKGEIAYFLRRICDIIELVLAVLTIAGIVIAIIGLVPQLGEFWENRHEVQQLIWYLEMVFNIVIGVEFLKMLCRPDADTVVEVLLFLVARHMIIGETGALEDLLSIISMAILFAVKKYINVPGKRAEEGIFHIRRQKDAEEKPQEKTE